MNKNGKESKYENPAIIRIDINANSSKAESIK